MQCIVETHSEYLINKLRCLSANAGDDSISKNSIIYFVEKENDASVYKPISINEYGVIANWPKGFFDEAEALASETIKAAAIKRKQRLIQTQQQIKGKEE
jgi:predicted ATPase